MSRAGWIGMLLVVSGCVTAASGRVESPPVVGEGGVVEIPLVSEPPSVPMPELFIPVFTRRLVDAEATGWEWTDTQMRWHYADHVADWQAITDCQRVGVLMQECQWACL